jgi:hypothetical protein
MDLGIIIAVVGTGMAIIGVIITMMFWVRSESNEIRISQKEDRKDLLEVVYAIREESTKQINAIQLEIKDFHFKLIDIERNKK